MKNHESHNQASLPHNIGGHMLYRKEFDYDEDLNPIFVKTFDPSLISDKTKIPGMIAELDHEASMYDYVRSSGFEYLPEVIEYDHHSLRISAYLEQEGWHWNVPEDRVQAVEYSEDILAAIDEIDNIPIIGQSKFSSPRLFIENGWNKVLEPETNEKILDKIETEIPKLHDQSRKGAEELARIVKDGARDLADLAIEAYMRRDDHLGHFDARPSNIGWHPELGVKIIDWSWASNTSTNSDSTMFLIDAHKADFETRELPSFYDKFDRRHAALFIGYWLARSIAPAQDPNVRFHQFAAAATATTLIKD